MNITPTFRKFHFQRHEDSSGVSGTGRVAEGIVFSDGQTVVRWLSACGSTNIYPNLEAVLQVHGHAGNTEIVFDDPAPESIDAAADGLRKKIENIPGFIAIGVGAEELFVYATKAGDYPETFGGHKVTYKKTSQPKPAGKRKKIASPK